MVRPIGRPMIYDDVLRSLEDDVAYTASTIANVAEELGMLAGPDKKHARDRVRVAMGRFKTNKNFPAEGDVQVIVRGQARIPGWFGWRWKAAIIE